MAPSKETDALVALQVAISNLNALLHSFLTALQSPTLSHSSSEDSLNPLALLSDASQIFKAQITKLSLLLLNKPFTPSAIACILNSLSNSCLPAMMSALEVCSAEKYTELLHHYIQTTLSRVMMELLGLLASIPQNEHGIENTRGRDTLASTGVLWAECDKMMALGSGGLTQIAAERVEEYHGLLKDAIAELEEWDPDDESESDTDSLTSNKRTIPGTRMVDSSLEKSFQSLSLSPIAALRTRALSMLRLIRILYPALKKRRILTFPNINTTTAAQSLPTLLHVQTLDQLIKDTRQFTEETDEVAGDLYAGDEKEVEDRLMKLANMAKLSVERVHTGWSGKEDEFSGWAEKWIVRLEEVRAG